MEVAIRMRPLLNKEAESSLQWLCEDDTIYTQGAEKVYSFDRVYGPEAETDTIYRTLVEKIVLQSMEGFHGTVFTYGQSGSGKTYTVDGLTCLAINTIYDFIERHQEREFILRLSYVELYNEHLFDLLAQGDSPNLIIREDVDRNIFIENVFEKVLTKKEDAFQQILVGNEKRRFAETKKNDRSSRAHCILRIIIESRERDDEEDCSPVLLSHLNLVDLAGSEKASQNSGDRLKEGCHINKSLLALSLVVKKLSENQSSSHVSYRDSKLTRILQNALGGNSRTLILCTVAPTSLDETVSTLRFADNARLVKNKPKQNEIMSLGGQLKEALCQIQKLQARIKELEHKEVSSPLEDYCQKRPAKKIDPRKSIFEHVTRRQSFFVTTRHKQVVSDRHDFWGGASLLPQSPESVSDSENHTPPRTAGLFTAEDQSKDCVENIPSSSKEIFQFSQNDENNGQHLTVLEDELQVLKNELFRLQNQLVEKGEDKNNEELKAMTSQMTELEDKMQSLICLIDEKDKEIEDMTSHATELEGKVQSLVSLIDEKDKVLENLKKENHDVQVDIEKNLEDKMQSFRALMDKKNEEIENLKKENHDIQVDIEKNLEDKMQSFRALMDKKNEEIENLKKDNHDVQVDIEKNLEDKMQSFRALMDKKNEEIENLKKENHDIQVDIEKNLEDKMQSFRALMDKKNEEIENLKKENHDIQIDIEKNLEDKMQSFRALMDKKNEEIENLKKENHDSQVDIEKNLEDKMQSFRALMDKKNEEIENLKKENHKIQIEIEKKVEEKVQPFDFLIGEKDEEIENLKKENRDVQMDVEKNLEDKILSFGIRMDEKNEEIGNLKKENHDSQVDIEKNLEDKMQSFRALMDKKNEEIENLKKENHKIQIEIEKKVEEKVQPFDFLIGEKDEEIENIKNENKIQMEIEKKLEEKVQSFGILMDKKNEEIENLKEENGKVQMEMEFLKKQHEEEVESYKRMSDHDQIKMENSHDLGSSKEEPSLNLENKIQSLGLQMDEKEKQIEAVASHAKEFEDKVQSFGRLLDEKNKEIENLKEQNGKLQVEMELLKKQCKEDFELYNRMTDHQQIQMEKSDDHEPLIKKRREESSQKDTLAPTVDELGGKIKTLMQQLQEKDDKVETLDFERRKALWELKKAEKTCKDESDYYKKAIDCYKMKLRKLQDLGSSFDKQQGEMGAKHEDKDKKIEAMTSHATELKDQVQSLGVLVDEKDKTIKAMTSHAMQLEGKVESIGFVVDEKDKEIENLKKEYRKAQMDIEQLKKQCKEDFELYKRMTDHQQIQMEKSDDHEPLIKKRREEPSQKDTLAPTVDELGGKIKTLMQQLQEKDDKVETLDFERRKALWELKKAEKTCKDESDYYKKAIDCYKMKLRKLQDLGSSFVEPKTEANQDL